MFDICPIIALPIPFIPSQILLKFNVTIPSATLYIDFNPFAKLLNIFPIKFAIFPNCVIIDPNILELPKLIR